MPDGIRTVLDAGLGDGYITDYLLDKGKDVTAIGLCVDSYGPNISRLRQRGLKLYESWIEKTPFEDGKFDAVVFSHILEHLPNMGEALQEVRRVLKDDGYLLLFVPAYENVIASGHINIGWNLGRLMYVLAINGFDAKNGQFVHYGLSLCAYVKKSSRPIPSLRCDSGDLRMLAENDFFPNELKQTIIENDGFDGEILACHFPDADNLLWEVNHSKRMKAKRFLLQLKAASDRKNRKSVLEKLESIIHCEATIFP